MVGFTRPFTGNALKKVSEMDIIRIVSNSTLMFISDFDSDCQCLECKSHFEVRMSVALASLPSSKYGASKRANKISKFSRYASAKGVWTTTAVEYMYTTSTLNFHEWILRWSSIWCLSLLSYSDCLHHRVSHNYWTLLCIHCYVLLALPHACYLLQQMLLPCSLVN